MNKKSTLRSVANDYLTHPKKERAITLIALIVTIIVLLILAGVTIATLTGENGLLAKASNAREETKRAEAIEDINLKIIEVQTEKQGCATLEDLVEYLDNLENEKYKVTKENGSLTSSLVAGSITIAEIGNAEKLYITNIKYNYEIEVNSDLTVTENVTASTGQSSSGKISQEIVGNNENFESTDIQNFEINIEQQNNKKLKISTKTLEKKNGVDIAGYVWLINGKAKACTTDGEYIIQNVEMMVNTYQIQAVAIDDNFKFKYSNEINTEIASVQEFDAEYKREQTISLLKGKYKLELWGAQGGSANYINKGRIWWIFVWRNPIRK